MNMITAVGGGPHLSWLTPMQTTTKYTETKGSTVYRNPQDPGCSDPSAARALLRGATKGTKGFYRL